MRENVDVLVQIGKAINGVIKDLIESPNKPLEQGTGAIQILKSVGLKISFGEQF